MLIAPLLCDLSLLYRLYDDISDFRDRVPCNVLTSVISHSMLLRSKKRRSDVAVTYSYLLPRYKYTWKCVMSRDDFT